MVKRTKNEIKDAIKEVDSKIKAARAARNTGAYSPSYTKSIISKLNARKKYIRANK